MKKDVKGPRMFASLSDAHRAFGLPQPKHPLISLIKHSDGQFAGEGETQSHVLGFYKISYKPRLSGRLKYGQSYYDFDEGGLMFAAPGQVVGPENEEAKTNLCGTSIYTLLIHPDFFLQNPLAKKIRQYGFFSYATNEALHLSEEEKATIVSILNLLEAELNSRIDGVSQDIVLAQIELLLNYANRFYQRQFITRRVVNHDLLQKLEELLERYFADETSMNKGLPSVAFLAEQLHLSPSYLSDMLRALTGRSAQQHIHDKLIEKAKEILATTQLTVSEVAYALGFEHSQSFSKLFKTKTNLSPLAFRRSFN